MDDPRPLAPDAAIADEVSVETSLRPHSLAEYIGQPRVNVLALNLALDAIR